MLQLTFSSSRIFLSGAFFMAIGLLLVVPQALRAQQHSVVGQWQADSIRTVKEYEGRIGITKYEILPDTYLESQNHNFTEAFTLNFTATGTLELPNGKIGNWSTQNRDQVYIVNGFMNNRQKWNLAWQGADSLTLTARERGYVIRLYLTRKTKLLNKN